MREFKEEYYRQRDKSDLKYQVPYLEALANHYRQKCNMGGENSWTHLLKVGLRCVSTALSCTAQLRFESLLRCRIL